MRMALRVFLIIMEGLGAITFIQNSLFFPIIGEGRPVGVLIGIGGLAIAIICWRVHNKLFKKRIEIPKQSSADWFKEQFGPMMKERDEKK